MVKADKVPIYDKDAEAMVIGSVVLEPGCLNGIDLDPEDFFIEDHSRIWEAVLSLQERRAELNQTTVAREARIETWVIKQVMAEALPVEAPHYADIVKEMSRRRKLIGSVDGLLKEFHKKHFSSRELADQLQVCLNSLDFPTNSSRVVTIANPRVIESQPPTYELTVSTVNGKTAANLKITSTDLDKPLVFRKKVREQLKINPILPKQFDAFVHQLLQKAEMVQGSGDASADESLCYWIKEWFASASEAETSDDLSQGYLEREGACWFLVERLINYIYEHNKVKLDRSAFWSLIHDRGGRRSKMLSVGGKKVRVWGIDKSFFEESEPADSEQATLDIDDDLKWLESEDV